MLGPAGVGGEADLVAAFRRLAITTQCGLALLTAGCDPITDGPANAGPDGAGAAGKVAALQQLDTLSVRDWASMSGYSRERFPHWASQGNGCDTRDSVLKRDGTGVVATGDCKITEGRWLSPYDQRTIIDPADVDIDHVVPLANAWRTGAAGWTDEKRGDFANDLTRPELIAVTASVNRSKGDQDPSQWRPPSKQFWCVYAEHWIAVKAGWQLFVTAEEKTALQQMLGTC
jgi:hypothetical protein